MKEYSGKISLIKNGRGVYCIDTTMGCNSGLKENPNGCYGDCYAARTAKIYGFDFSKTILRDFQNQAHHRKILHDISLVKMPFIRIGASGDPSENWQHTIKIIKALENCNKEIIIITRHWTILTEEQLLYLSKLNICINTSVSALDSDAMRDNALLQYNRIKPYCKSVLRIVSCSFNLSNNEGIRLNAIQSALFINQSTLDTVFRPSNNNPFVTDGIINARKELFNGRPQLASKLKSSTYMGSCSTCHEMCGVNISSETNSYPNKKGIIKQLRLFK